MNPVFIRINERIRAREVRVVVGATGQQLGILKIEEALRQARLHGLDLIEVAPNVNPPVCRIADSGKFKYEMTKKEKDQKNNTAKIKEIKFRVKIGTHDYETKLRHAEEFLSKGNKVKIQLQFRGRENAHKELGMEMMHKIIQDLDTMAQVDMPPKLVGRIIGMTLAPLPISKRKHRFLHLHEAESKSSITQSDDPDYHESDDSIETRLYLFDLDGTIFKSGGMALKALISTAQSYFGESVDLSLLKVPGSVISNTVSNLFNQISELENSEISDSEKNLNDFIQKYTEHFTVLLKSCHDNHLLPGVVPLLKWLKSNKNHVIGLLTGNVRSVAKMFLKKYDLWDYFSFGAFSDDHYHRDTLAKIALQKAKQFSEKSVFDQVYVIGDTLYDIQAGQSISAITVAVATGDDSKEVLISHQPDIILDDLSDLSYLKTVLTSFKRS